MEENIHILSILVGIAKYPEAQELSTWYSFAKNAGPGLYLSFSDNIPSPSAVLQMAQHPASPRGWQTVSLIHTVLLFFQMDVIYDLNPIYKNSIFMLNFYITCLFTCQAVGMQTFLLSDKHLHVDGLYPLVPCRMAWRIKGHPWIH